LAASFARQIPDIEDSNNEKNLVTMQRKYRLCKMIYFTGKACEEHKAYEGIAFEE
jgi:hypothetical protein